MNDLVHFAIHADDCQRALAFYRSVFGWSFQPWGPPDFWLIETGPGAPRGALQQRHEPLTGSGMSGYECTLAVEDVDAIAAAIREHGGEVLLAPTEIEGVGTLIQFRDTEGNRACAMQYVPGLFGGAES